MTSAGFSVAEERVYLRIKWEPRGAGYERLLRAITPHVRTGSLVFTQPEHVWQSIPFLAALRCLGCTERIVQRWPANGSFSRYPSVPHSLLVEFDWQAALPLLLRARRQMYGWCFENPPEDLDAYDADGRAVLVTMSHERLGWLDLPAIAVGPVRNAVRGVVALPRLARSADEPGQQAPASLWRESAHEPTGAT